MKILIYTLLMLPGFLISQQETAPVIFIYDASGSMWGKLNSEFKYKIASDVLSETLSDFSNEQAFGLVAYGHRTESDCNDIEVLVDYKTGTAAEVTEKLNSLRPIGRTPLSRSVQLVVNDLKSENAKATVILLTDGLESCDGNVCDIVTAAKSQGVDILLHIVGFDMKDLNKEELICASQISGGKYFDAEDRNELSEVLKKAGELRVDTPDPNFSICTKINGKEVDALVEIYADEYQTKIGSIRTYGDTAYFYSEVSQVSLVVKVLENTDLSDARFSNILLENDNRTHKDVDLDSGDLNILTTNNEEPWDALILVTDSYTKEEQARGRSYGREKNFTLSPGIYDISAQAMKLKGTNNTLTTEKQHIKAGSNTNLDFNFDSAVARIEVRSSNSLVDALIQFYDPDSGKYLDGGRTYTSASSNPAEFQMISGTYKVVIKYLETSETKTLTLELPTGQEVLKTVDFE